MTVAIVDYGVGNLVSIQNMLRRTGTESQITSDAAVIEKADKIILPGVGAFDTCASKLQETGLVPLLEQKALIEKKPVLGICVGLQLLFENSEEGKLPGLGWVPGSVVKFDASKMDASLRIPHMGWTDVSAAKQSPLLEDMYEEPRFYFVHSYHPYAKNPADILLNAHYGYDFVAAVEKENIMGVQFHPEKSHKFGMKLLYNFVHNYQ